jgi:glycosyltransferase involved in cell wall biosynthesis
VALLRALAAVNRETPLADVVEVSLVGPFVDEYRTDAAALGIESFVTFRNRVSAAEAARAAAGADVLLVIDAPSETPSVFLPSKLVDYLPFRKPILGITPPRGASARLLTRLGCEVAPPDDVDAIAARVRALIERWRAGALTVGPEFDRVAAEFDIRCTARQLHDVMTRAFA